MRSVPAALSVSLALAACGFDPATGGDDPTPDGAITDPDDRDGDGVVNDNCLGLANPDQRDHDGDGRGDPCDLCPHLAPATPADAADDDGDGIGAACDPDPAVRNATPYWNGFYDAPDAMWTVPAKGGALSDWELARRPDGASGWRQKELDNTQRHQLLLVGDRLEQFVQTALIIEEVETGGGAGPRSATVTLGFGEDGSQDIYFSCGVRQEGGVTQRDLIAAAQLDDTSIAGTAVQSWTGGAALRLTASARRAGNGSGISCVGTDGAVTRDPARTSAISPNGRVGLRAYGMRVWFDYIFVVDPQPTS